MAANLIKVSNSAMRKKKDLKEVLDLLSGLSRERNQLIIDLEDLQKLPEEFEAFNDQKIRLVNKVDLILLDVHLGDLNLFTQRFEKLKYLEHLSIEDIFDNFYQVISNAEKTCLPNFSSFSPENRERMQQLQFLNMKIELDRYNDQEYSGKPEYMKVTYEDVLKSI